MKFLSQLGMRTTYECSDGGSKFCSQEGKSDAAKETEQRRDSHEKTNLLLENYILR